MATTGPAQAPPAAAQRGLHDKIVDNWVTAIFTLGGALVAMVATSWWQSRDPHLTVVVPGTVKFQGERNQFGIVSFVVASDGSKEADAVECALDLGAAKIQDVHVRPKNLGAKITHKDGTAGVLIERLNAGESVEVAAWVSDAVTIPEKIDVSVRAKGLIGERGQIKSDRIERQSTYLVWVIVAQAVWAGFLSVTSIMDRRRVRQAEDRRRAVTARRMAELDEREAKWKREAEEDEGKKKGQYSD